MRDTIRDTLKDAWIVLVQAVKGFANDNGAVWAAAIAYFALLSLFPLILAIMSIGMMFVEPIQVLYEASRLLQEFFPAGQGELLAIVANVLEARGSIGLLSILVLLWAGSRVFGTVMKGLNVAFNTGENFSLVKRTLVELSMLVILGGFYLVATAAQFAIAYLVNNITFFDDSDGLLLRLGAEAVVVLLLFLAFFLTYRFVPRTEVNSRSAALGAGLGSILFMIARPLFVNYVGQFANFRSIYGPVAVIITLVIWFWVVALILLFSGEIASHYQAIVLERKPPQMVERQHVRRSPTKKDVEGTQLPPKEEELIARD